MPVRQISAFLDRITDGFAVVDDGWRILDLRLATDGPRQQALDRDTRRLPGASFWQTVPELQGTPVQQRCHAAMRDRRPVRFEHVLRDVGRCFEVHAYPTAVGLSLYFHDVTDRKRAEDALRVLAETAAIFAMPLDYQERLRRLADLVVPSFADWCIVDVVDDGRIHRLHVAHADPAAAALADAMRHLAHRIDEAGSPIAEALRTGIPQLHAGPLHPESLRVLLSPERVRLAGEIGIRSSMIVPLSARGRTIGALTFFVAGRRPAYTDDDFALARELAAHAALAVDNARLYEEAQQARREAERRRQELEEVIRSRARLTRGLSHDLKNPMGAAEGYTQLLERGMLGALSPRQLEGVQRIRRSLRAAFRLTQELVELARGSPDRIDVAFVPIDVGRLIRETVEEYQASAGNAGLHLRAEAPEGLPAVRSDPARVQQVLGNLLSNAIKYTPAGGAITITAAAVRERPDADTPPRIRIDVSDTGPGIPAHLRDSIFEEFVRGDSRQRPGSGIGLAISRRIARTLGADLTVASDTGRGATFTLWLPADAPGLEGDLPTGHAA